MKKALIIILALAVILMPAVVFSQDTQSALEQYIESDTTLSEYIDDYAKLQEDRDELIEKYEKMRIWGRNSFDRASSTANKEILIIQVDYTIENKFDSIIDREHKLELDFRNTYLNLYNLKKAAENAEVKAGESSAELAVSKQSNSSGYISDNQLLSVEYSAMSDRNKARSSQRSYESALRSFNLVIGNPLDYEAYDFDFEEELLTIMELQTYLDSAVTNSPQIKMMEQQLEKYNIKQEKYDVYSFTTNLSHVKEALKLHEINKRLQELDLEEAKASLAESIQIKYDSVVIERERIGLSQISVRIMEDEYSTNTSLYNRGFLTNQELQDSKEALAEAKKSLTTAIYAFNTKVKSLEYDCAYYPEESSSNEN